MTLSEYVKMALRTEGKCKQTGELFPQGQRLLHASLGFSSELAELIEGENYIEELGDIFWYLNLAFDACGLHLDRDDASVDADPVPMEDLPILFGKFADICKRHIFYGESLTEENKKGDIPLDLAKDKLQEILSDVYAIISDNDLDIQEILEKNITKLERRYPNLRFEADHALDRNLEKEQAVFTGQSDDLVDALEN